jgi:hypothetical protein
MAKGQKTGGRRKGTPNKLTADAREVIRLAAERAGGVDALARFAIENPAAFWPLYAKLIPVTRELRHDYGALTNVDLKGISLEELEALAK